MRSDNAPLREGVCAPSPFDNATAADSSSARAHLRRQRSVRVRVPTNVAAAPPQRPRGSCSCPNGAPKRGRSRRKARAWPGLGRALATTGSGVLAREAGMDMGLSASQYETRDAADDEVVAVPVASLPLASPADAAAPGVESPPPPGVL